MVMMAVLTHFLVLPTPGRMRSRRKGTFSLLHQRQGIASSLNMTSTLMTTMVPGRKIYHRHRYFRRRGAYHRLRIGVETLVLVRRTGDAEWLMVGLDRWVGTSVELCLFVQCCLVASQSTSFAQAAQ